MTIATQTQQNEYSRPFTPALPVRKATVLSPWRVVYPYLCIAWIALLLLGSMAIVHLHQRGSRSNN